MLEFLGDQASNYLFDVVLNCIAKENGVSKTLELDLLYTVESSVRLMMLHGSILRLESAYLILVCFY